MPFVDNKGTRIHYHVEGEGPPLVLVHGLTTSMNQWRNAGYVDALKDDYKLILLDGRGHGYSDKLFTPDDYEPTLLAGDVTSVLDDLGIEKSLFFGYSMGARVGYSVAAYAPERISAYILGGQHPYRRTNDQREADEKAIVRWERRKEAIIAGSKSRRTPEDYDVFIAFRKKIMEWPPFEMDLLMKGLNVPVLLYAGGADERNMLTEQFTADLPDARFFTLEGLNHDDALLRIDLVLPHVTEFLNEATKKLELTKG